MVRLSEWKVEETTPWEVIAFEQRGRREKAWVRPLHDRRNWLRKVPRDSRPYEPAIEALMLRLASLAGLQAADGHVAIWQTEDGNAVRGIVVRSFLDVPSETLEPGASWLQRHDRRYDLQSKWAQTPDLVLEALRAQTTPGLVCDFAHMLVFDAWVGNSDRHQENWGIIRHTDGSRRLAPLYDPAACLGTELQEDHKLMDPKRRTLQGIRKYIARCGSGFGDGVRKLPMSALVAELRRWPEWYENVAQWLADFRQALDTFVSVLDQVDESWLPAHRKAFVLTLLRERLDWLAQNASTSSG